MTKDPSVSFNMDVDMENTAEKVEEKPTTKQEMNEEEEEMALMNSGIDPLVSTSTASTTNDDSSSQPQTHKRKSMYSRAWEGRKGEPDPRLQGSSSTLPDGTSEGGADKRQRRDYNGITGKPSNQGQGKRGRIGGNVGEGEEWGKKREGQGEGEDGEEQGEKEVKLPKRKVALFVGYSGTGYNGMQL